MALREAGGQGEMALYKNLKPGDVVAEGFYVGDRRGKFGPIYEIADADTEQITLCPSNGHLRYKFEQYVQKGNYVQIVYDGMEEIKKGKWSGTECHMFRLFIDSDRVYDGNINEDDSPETPAAPVAPAQPPRRSAPPPPPPAAVTPDDDWGYGDDDDNGIL
jgi:hypothetical protein